MRLCEPKFGEEPKDYSKITVPRPPDPPSGNLDTWNLYECDAIYDSDGDIVSGDAGYEVEDHVSGGRTAGLAAVIRPNSNQKASVFIHGISRTDGNQYFGSGVLIDDETVLTAAHVIADEAACVDPYNLVVCSLGNLYAGAECVRAESVSAPGGRYDTTTANDYGIIKLRSPFSASAGWMAMSNSPGAVIERATHYHDGFPKFAPGCVKNWTNADSTIVVGGTYIGVDYLTGDWRYYSYNGGYLYHAYGPVNRINVGTIDFEVSSAAGMSGGPYYYCPSVADPHGGSDSECFITAVTSGHQIDRWRGPITSGPRVSRFRRWAISHMWRL